MVKIKEIYLDNFKSFEDCKIKLDDFNIVIAPNNAGKSNLILALEFIDFAIKNGLKDAIDEFGGIEFLKNYRNHKKNITIGIDFFQDIDGIVFIKRYMDSYEIPEANEWINSYTTFKDMNIKSLFSFNEEEIEKIQIEIKGKYRTDNLEIFKDKNKEEIRQVKEEILKKRFKNFSIKIYYENKSNKNRTNIELTISNKKYINQEILNKNKEGIFEFLRLDNFLLLLKNNNPKKENKLSKIFNFEHLKDRSNLWNFPIFLYKNYIKIFTYYFSSHEIKKTSDYKSGDILNKTGTNLASVLSNIKGKNPELFEEISTSLIGIVEEIEGIDIKEDILGRAKLIFKEETKKGIKKLPVDIISDGTVNLIATLTALYENIQKTVIAIEEPERHLHLRAISYLLEEFRNIANEKQILITTQSSEILNSLDFKNDNLIFLFRDYEGNTKSITHKEIPRFKQKLKLYGNDISLLIKNEGLGYLGDYLE